MQITDIRCFLVEVPPPAHRFIWRRGLMGSMDGMTPTTKHYSAILKMETDEGVTGHADAYLFQFVHHRSVTAGSDGITVRRKATHLLKPSSTERSASSCSIERAPS